MALRGLSYKDVRRASFYLSFCHNFSKVVVTDDRIRFACAEFFLALEVVQKFDFRLFDTTWERDVDSVRDCFIGESHPNKSWGQSGDSRTFDRRN